jgi:hypothetical protein
VLGTRQTDKALLAEPERRLAGGVICCGDHAGIMVDYAFVLAVVSMAVP